MLVFLKFILSRSFVFYLICFLLIWRIMDYHQLMDNAVPQTMSRLTPPMDYFAEFVDRQDHEDQFKLLNCVNYHKAVAYFFPYQKAEAEGMLGFCYERLGDMPRAVASYKQAIAINPDFFWPYYDLGVIDYAKGQYAQAIEYFKKAIEQDPLKNFVLLSRSKVYNDVRLSKKEGTYDFLEGLKQGQEQAYILLMDSLYKTGSYDLLLDTALYGIKQGLDTQGIFYYYAGLAAFYQKSFEHAMDFLQAAVQDNPDNADAILYIGMCLKIANKMDMAQLFFNKAAQLHQQQGPGIKPYLKGRVRFF